MSANTTIEWTDATWNPVTGCAKVSKGCKHCYAERLFPRSYKHTGRTFGDVKCHEDRLDKPLRWRKPRRVFVNSMSDLFHPDVPDEFIDRVFASMALAPHHTFQVLTKRPARALDWSTHAWARIRVREINRCRTGGGYWHSYAPRVYRHADWWRDHAPPWPLPNVWLGVSVEDHATANDRVPLLLQTPAAVRFVSAEPLLGPVDLQSIPVSQITKSLLGGEPMWVSYWDALRGSHGHKQGASTGHPSLDWVIVGGESGPGARPMHPDWARSIREQCVAAGVPFLFKQWGAFVYCKVEDDESMLGGRAFLHPSGGKVSPVLRKPGPSGTMRGHSVRLMLPGESTRGAVMLAEDLVAVRVGKKAAGRELDGRTWDEFPSPEERQ